MTEENFQIPNELRGGWLFNQFRASAERLASRPPSLLSPTARALKADITAWMEALAQAAHPPAAPSLHVVSTTAKPMPSNEQQLPLIRLQ